MRPTLRSIACLALTGLLACANEEGNVSQPDTSDVVQRETGASDGPSAGSSAEAPEEEALADVPPAESATGTDSGSGGAPSDGAPDEGAPVEAAPAPVVAAGNWSDGDTIPSGRDNVPDIQILKVHKNGSGPKCGTGKRATLAYKAMLADGTVLDPGTRPFSFAVGKREAIVGWDIVVAEMRIGDSFTILLPQQLAYGPSRGDLKFDMELLSVQ